ncbi:esterase [Marinomonas posidonica]|uniref:Phospholipase/Carboxylesterase n=1 Tax=Marinomonas posidonica (strain CECT 7376 / NCIMB 14433 / IVIA-Po-181) TaxID=491952 RepID=F6CSX5_MARPP|nr:esterase [Marinomonas posidonica]AEF53965.1 phospholipase/Carboxylesterase [Marinomonas posidonica IVIA-Po-181]
MNSIVIQTPSSPKHLFLLFHGVGASPQSMAPLAKLIAEHHPDAAVVSVVAPQVSDLGQGFQWFSVRGVTEENRVERVEAALPFFIDCVQFWQTEYQLSYQDTSLIGFSQGAIMSLSATQLAEPILASRIISLSGRFSTLPQVAPSQTHITFFHGEADEVINVQFAKDAYQALDKLGADTSLETIPQLGHTINQAETTKLLSLLKNG